jgi:hypothetical protein
MANLRIMIIATRHAPRSLVAAVARGGALKLSSPHNLGAKMMNHRPRNGDDEADQRRSAALIGLIIILALAIAGVWLVRELRQKSALEDCLMSGRTNCAPIETPSR